MLWLKILVKLKEENYQMRSKKLTQKTLLTVITASRNRPYKINPRGKSSELKNDYLRIESRCKFYSNNYAYLPCLPAEGRPEVKIPKPSLTFYPFKVNFTGENPETLREFFFSQSVILTFI